jgi:DNA-binding transcriptional regulator YhcF (GntR family)
MEFNYSSNVPLYIQVADQIKEAILIGSFPEGQQVPLRQRRSLKISI